MTALVSPPPSPPIPDSPGSLSSTSSHSASSSNAPPKPASPPPHSYTSFDQVRTKTPTSMSAKSNTSTASPAGSAASSRVSRRGAGHRSSQSMSRLGGGASVSFAASTSGPSGNTSNSPSLRRTHRMSTSVLPSRELEGENPPHRSLSRSRTLSFSSSQQAFLPTAPRLAASTSTASVVLPFPSVEEGVVSSSISLDRASSTASSSSVPARRPRPPRATSISTRSAQTLRVPGASAGRPGRAEAPTDYLEAKVVILGSSGVGKTSLINRSTYGTWNSSRSTVGATFHTKKLSFEDTRVAFQLWDSGGQERFRSIAPLYYRGAEAAVLVYDVTDETSLEDIKYWLGELRDKMTSELMIIVVGTKADLADSYATVPLATAQRSIALFLDELDHPPNESTSSTLSRAPPPPLPPPPPRPRPQPSLSRSRTISTPLSSQPSTPSIVTTAPLPSAPPTQTTFDATSLSSRTRKQSNKLSSSTSGHSHRPSHSMSSSMTLPDLSSYTIASLNLSTSRPPHTPGHSAALDSLVVSSGMARSSSGGSNISTSYFSPLAPGSSSVHHSHHPGELVRSPTTPSLSLGAASRGLMSLSSLATGGGSRRLSHDERLRREWEAYAAAKRKEEEREEARVQKIVEECKVKVVEVSAKDGFGIEEIFYTIAEQLISRKAEIEAARVLRSRHSIIIRNEDHIDVSQPGWCAC